MNKNVESLRYSQSRTIHRKVLTRIAWANARAPKIATIIAVALLAVLFLGSFLIRGDFAIQKVWIPFLLMICLFWIYHLFAMPLITARSAQGDSANSVTYKFSIDQNDFIEHGDDGSFTQLAISSLHKIDQHKDSVVLWQNLSLMHILPRSAFKTEEDWQNAISHLGDSTS